MKNLILVLFFCLFGTQGFAADKAFVELRFDERTIKDVVYQAWNNSFKERVVNILKDRLGEMRPYTNKPEVVFSDLYTGLKFNQTTRGLQISLDINTDVSFLPFSWGHGMKRIHFAGPINLKAYLGMKDGALMALDPELDFSAINLKGVWYLEQGILKSIRKAITKELKKQEIAVKDQLPAETFIMPTTLASIPLPGDGQSVLLTLEAFEHKKPNCSAPPADGKTYEALESGWLVIRFGFEQASEE